MSIPPCPSVSEWTIDASLSNEKATEGARTPKAYAATSMLAAQPRSCFVSKFNICQDT